ncbi:BLUF domain-containing protein [Novosphingobium malaysiense]|uniref:Blue light sensor protein n=1 Tax=Novosphingobium malaysiense TaxID=1348853 RepID=A0A0B1ZS07_9SPHN|nr:BLUF domain-containing protein [Novosphingobium malaysiense]KHK92034.1 blue light sensor protein [Novosphingobium malaysiense]
MDDDLFRLVYYSRNCIGTDPTDQIDAILLASRRNNASAGVTGALLFNMGCFGQVLEGPRRAVEATFERIQRDERHSDVSLLDFKAVDARHFANWSMAFAGSRQIDAARYAGIGERSGFDPARITADRLCDLLRTLTIEEEYQA